MSKRNWKKGSFTAEAAMVLPLVLFAVFGILYLSFHVHNRSWLSAAAGEAALCGKLEGVYEKGDVYGAASQRACELAKGGFFAAEVTPGISVGASVQVSYGLKTTASVFGFSWETRIAREAAVLKPADYIREQRMGWNTGGET